MEDEVNEVLARLSGDGVSNSYSQPEDLTLPEDMSGGNATYRGWSILILSGQNKGISRRITDSLGRYLRLASPFEHPCNKEAFTLVDPYD
ncbi:MAG: hypothetical protein WC554_19250 [Clostridia bacterium]|jgi:hypothetical protein